MSDLFHRDAHGAPCGMALTGSPQWSEGAEGLLRDYLATLPLNRLRSTARSLRLHAENAAQTQQYQTVTKTTLLAQIARLAWLTTEGETDR